MTEAASEQGRSVTNAVGGVVTTIGAPKPARDQLQVVPDAGLPPEIGDKGSEGAFFECVLHLPASKAARLTAQLTGEDFTDPGLRVLLGAVQTLASDAAPLQPALIVAHMRSTGQASCFTADRGPDLVVADLYAAPSVPASAAYYLRIIKRNTARRQAQTVGVRVQQAAEGLSDVDLAASLVDAAASLVAAAKTLRGVTT